MTAPSDKKISIIIPNYNSQEYITECLDSVLNQDYPNIEVIVIDDGSTDHSLEKIQPYLDKITLITQVNQGACIARNAGLRIASGEYIKFLDSDDYLEKNIISSQVKVINSLQENEIVYGDFTLKYPEKNIYHHNKSLSLTKTLEEIIVTDILTSTPLHRKSHLNEINGFDTRFKSGQEWNLHIRLAAIGVKFIHTTENVYFYRQHNSPDRISIKKKSDPNEEFNKYYMTYKDVLNIIDNNNIRSVFSSNIWKLGRHALLENHIKIANKCFEESLAIFPQLLSTFPLSYKITNKLFKYQTIEKLVSFRKKFTKFRKRLFN